MDHDARADLSGYENITSDGHAAARVLSVDDHARFRTLLLQIVEATPGLESVGEADCGERAVTAADELRPDLVVMDVVMPGLGGIRATSMIKSRRPSTIVVLISTTHPDDLPHAREDSAADEIIWKSDLRSSVLAEIWQRHNGR